MRLSDCFMETIVYVNFLVGEGADPDTGFDRAHEELIRLLEKGRECAGNAAVNMEDFELARFAVCAWIDEKILASNWRHRSSWQREQLQRKFYNTTNAGEEFFEKMNGLGPHQKEVREIYFLCLCLGFMGRYCHEGDEYLLEQVKVSNLKLLLGSSIALPSLQDETLFSEAYPLSRVESGAPGIRRGFSFFTAAALLSPVVLFGALFVIYHFILKGVGDNILGLIY